MRCVSSAPVLVSDENGLPFYYMESFKGEPTFNLPEGVYWSENDLIEIKPLIYITPPVPKPEKRIKNELPEYNITVQDNPNKASVNITTGDIFLDPKFASKQKPLLTYILFHELSHNLYYSEIKCDIYAASEMLKRGFNPSQCFYSSYFCLSSKNTDRKEDLFNWLKKVKVK